MTTRSERLQIAAQCLQGLLANSGICEMPCKELVSIAMGMSEALIAAIDASEPKPKSVQILVPCPECGQKFAENNMSDHIIYCHKGLAGGSKPTSNSREKLIADIHRLRSKLSHYESLEPWSET